MTYKDIKHNEEVNELLKKGNRSFEQDKVQFTRDYTE